MSFDVFQETVFEFRLLVCYEYRNSSILAVCGNEFEGEGEYLWLRKLVKSFTVAFPRPPFVYIFKCLFQQTKNTQMAFVLILIQELVQGKGVIQGLQEGDPVNYIVAGGFFVTVLGFTAFLAIKGDDDYVDKAMK